MYEAPEEAFAMPCHLIEGASSLVPEEAVACQVPIKRRSSSALRLTKTLSSDLSAYLPHAFFQADRAENRDGEVRLNLRLRLLNPLIQRLLDESRVTRVPKAYDVQTWML